MLKKAFILVVLTALAVFACQRQHARSGARSATDQRAGATQKAAAALEASADVEPMRMDEVLTSVDERLEQAGSSQLATAYNQPRQEASDRTEAPYFHVASEDGAEDLPLKSTSAEVDIAGVIAQVVVTQVYQNRGNTPIEAVYVFPGSTRSAVHGMRMTIGDRTIVAKIEERDKARADYETAKQQGKRASLLEQERPNVFTMNVANIMPGDIVKTELLYTELLVPEDGTYSFVYPTVVGPRNPMGADPETTKWVASPYLESGKKEPYAFDIDVRLSSPIGIKAIDSPSHKVSVSYPSAKTARVALAKKGGGNRDYVLRYRLAGNRIESGAMLYDHGDEKFFLMMMEPPKRVKQAAIPPREYVFVLDVSGSMHGFPLDTAKELMRNLLKKMRPHDYFNIVVFAGNAGVLHPQSVVATPENVRDALEQIEQMQGGGGTNLMDALRTSYGLPRPEARAMSRSVVVVTDGYVAVEAKAFRFIRKRLGEANLFAFGIGSSVNRALIEGMARAGMGSPFVVLDQTQAADRAAKLQAYIESPVLTDIEVSFRDVDVYDAVPKALPDLMAARPLILFGKVRGTGKGSITVTGSSGGGDFRRSMTLDTRNAKADNRPLRSLWARKWVEQLMDQHAALGGDEQIEKAVTNLGLGYGLLTAFTSFVAIDSEIANTTGELTTAKQPLPLPKGVSNYAVPSSAPMGGGMGPARASRGLRAPPPMPSPSVAPMPAEPMAADAEKTEEEAKSDQTAVSVRVASLRNVERGHQAALRRLLQSTLSRCAAASGLRGTLRILIYADGRIAIRGGNSAFQSCLAATRTVDRLSAALSSAYLDDPKQPGVALVIVR